MAVAIAYVPRARLPFESGEHNWVSLSDMHRLVLLFSSVHEGHEQCKWVSFAAVRNQTGTNATYLENDSLECEYDNIIVSCGCVCVAGAEIHSYAHLRTTNVYI